MTSDDQEKPWEKDVPTATECIDLLERRAYLEQSAQERLVEFGDRTTLYAPAMREAYVFRFLANRLRAMQLERAKKKSWER